MEKINRFIQNIKVNIFKHKEQWALLLLFIILLDMLAKFPYLNILLTYPLPWNALLITWLACVGLFRLSSRATLAVSSSLIGIGMILLLLKKDELAEGLGNVIYVLIILALLQLLFEAKIKKYL